MVNIFKHLAIAAIPVAFFAMIIGAVVRLVLGTWLAVFDDFWLDSFGIWLFMMSIGLLLNLFNEYHPLFLRLRWGATKEEWEMAVRWNIIGPKEKTGHNQFLLNRATFRLRFEDAKALRYQQLEEQMATVRENNPDISPERYEEERAKRAWLIGLSDPYPN